MPTITREQLKQMLQQRQQQKSPQSPTPIKSPQSGTWSLIKDVGSAVVKGAADIVQQPARAMEQIGLGIGEIGMTPEQKTRTESFVKSGSDVNPAGYGKPVESVKEGIGVGMQAAANLATPVALEFGSVGLGVQGAATGAGKTLEEKGTVGEAAVSGVEQGALSFVFGKAGEFAGTVVGKGTKAASQAIKDSLKPVVEKLAPFLTGMSKQEIQMAVRQFPEKIAENLGILKSVSNPADAEATLRSKLLQSTQKVANAAKKKAEDLFSSGISTIEKLMPGITGDISKIGKSLVSMEEKFGQPRTQDEITALQGLRTIVTRPRENTLGGFRTLLSDVWDYADGLEQNSPARKAAMTIWNDTRKEMSSMTKGKIDPVFKNYAAFKSAWSEIKPIWSKNASDDAARGFVANLESVAKTGSRDALKYLERLSGMKGSSTGDITAYKLAKKLALEHRITGSRAGDILASLALPSLGGAVGGFVGGEKGKKVGEFVGVLGSAKLLSPELVSSILFKESENAGVTIMSPLRKRIGKLLSDPKTAQVLWRTLNQLMTNQQSDGTGQKQDTSAQATTPVQ